MTHQINVRENGFVEMAFVGETPWHGLGQNLAAGATIETWQVSAGMDWKVCRSRVRYGSDDAPRIMESKHVLFRSDTKDALAVVGEDYKIVQPKQILDFFAEFAESQHYQLETAGVSNKKGDQLEGAKTSPAFKRIISLFDGYGKGSQMAGSAGTAWGMVNAVTEYVDHHSRAIAQSNRLENAWFGIGDELKTKALELALEL